MISPVHDDEKPQFLGLMSEQRRLPGGRSDAVTEKSAGTCVQEPPARQASTAE
jgi:hypothetical protein